MRVIKCLSDHLFELEDLRSDELDVVHGYRVRFFRNSTFEVTEDVTAHVQVQEGHTTQVGNFLDYRERRGIAELREEYRGFEGEETMWLPVEDLLQDIPVLVREYLSGRTDNGSAMQRAHNQAISERSE